MSVPRRRSSSSRAHPQTTLTTLLKLPARPLRASGRSWLLMNAVTFSTKLPILLIATVSSSPPLTLLTTERYTANPHVIDPITDFTSSPSALLSLATSMSRTMSSATTLEPPTRSPARQSRHLPLSSHTSFKSLWESAVKSFPGTSPS